MSVGSDLVLSKLDKELFKLPVDDDAETETVDESEEGTVTSAEIDDCIVSATIEARAYLELTSSASLPSDGMVDHGIVTWAAGLLWNMKINTEASNYQEDRSGLTEGDKLIQRGKSILSTFHVDEIRNKSSHTSTGWYDHRTRP